MLQEGYRATLASGEGWIADRHWNENEYLQMDYINRATWTYARGGRRGRQRPGMWKLTVFITLTYYFLES